MDPFEVLGVARDATAEQVEARWRELARRLHPDQYPAAGDAERARLTVAMAELNQARHAALAALRRPSTTAAQDPTMARAASTLRSVPQPPATPPGAAWFVTAVVLGAVLLLVAVIVVVVLASSDDRPTAGPTTTLAIDSTEPPGPPTTLFVDWAIGACIGDGEFVVPVDCGVPNAGRIVLRTTAPEFCPDWSESFVRVDADVWCVDDDG
jgi:hypothetical protein